MTTADQLKPGSKPAKRRAVEVWCHAPKAKQVFLAGTFNGWDPKATPMTRVGQDWKVTLSVLPGLYSYNFVIDGRWVCDPNRMEPHDGGPCRFLITRWLG